MAGERPDAWREIRVGSAVEALTRIATSITPRAVRYRDSESGQSLPLGSWGGSVPRESKLRGSGPGGCGHGLPGPRIQVGWVIGWAAPTGLGNHFGARAIDRPVLRTLVRRDADRPTEGRFHPEVTSRGPDKKTGLLSGLPGPRIQIGWVTGWAAPTGLGNHFGAQAIDRPVLRTLVRRDADRPTEGRFHPEVTSRGPDRKTGLLSGLPGPRNQVGGVIGWAAPTGEWRLDSA